MWMMGDCNVVWKDLICEGRRSCTASPVVRLTGDVEGLYCRACAAAAEDLEKAYKAERDEFNAALPVYPAQDNKPGARVWFVGSDEDERMFLKIGDGYGVVGEFTFYRRRQLAAWLRETLTVLEEWGL